ncbi:MAG: hypothetical protein DI551_06880 [Micavibrio aeruginosavorus]|uniref:Polymerase n=1 Tax=Micavibrio aeruginosavorus TaxID=349221 RepID=A0A2W5PLW6_9BACT|nr:MAG: hypothetical protein DI551_06880 [Micavibrio aeruginosavorus]
MNVNLNAINPIKIFGVPGLLMILAVTYNTILAFISARGPYIGPVHVAAAESFLILFSAAYVGMKIGSYRNITPPLMFVAAIMMCFFYVSFMNEEFFLKGFRDMVLIAVFFMIGGLAETKNIISCFRFLAIIIFVFLLIENYATQFYVYLFKPAIFYANTRGVELLENDETGLFRNSLGFRGRFSYFMSTHRLSSIFLEQVSLANFAMILAIFTSTFWDHIKRWDRVLFIVTVVLMVLTNSSRTASFVVMAVFIGHFVFPLIPRYLNVAFLPGLLLLCWLVFYDPSVEVYNMSDNLKGRVGHSINFMSRLGADIFTGGGLDKIEKTGDTGYSYILLTQSIFGLITFWLFTALIVPPSDPSRKRFIHGAALYLYINLLIGAAILSIKVSAPFWFIAGYLYYKNNEKKIPYYDYNPQQAY